MVERCSKKDAMRLSVLQTVSSPPVLEYEALQQHRHSLGDEHTAEEDEQELGLEEDDDNAQRAAERKRARVAHEDFRWMAVVPEEANGRAKYRCAEHRELAGVLQVVDLQVGTRVDAADQIAEDRERAYGDRRESSCEP